MAIFGLSISIVLIGMALAGFAAVAVCYQRDICAARERLNHLNSHTIKTASGLVEYARTGEGYPILVVHGALGGFDQGLWLAQEMGLNIPKFQVISISRFGHLRSDVPANANLDAQANAFACLFDALEIRQAAVFAASGGSTSAIRFVARYPERVSALILLCPDAPPGMPLPPRFMFDTLLRSDFLYWAMITFFPKSVQNATDMVPRGHVLTSESVAEIRTILKGNLPISPRIDGFIFETYTTLSEFQDSISASSTYPLSEIKTPVLVIDALDDPITIIENVRALAEQMPNARLFTVPSGGHFFFGHREEVKEEIAEFLHSHGIEPQSETFIPMGG